MNDMPFQEIEKLYKEGLTQIASKKIEKLEKKIQKLNKEADIRARAHKREIDSKGKTIYLLFRKIEDLEKKLKEK
jgi:predicted RNase H-like nuclease (RuvC/YqgF family)